MKYMSIYVHIFLLSFVKLLLSVIEVVNNNVKTLRIIKRIILWTCIDTF